MAATAAASVTSQRWVAISPPAAPDPGHGLGHRAGSQVGREDSRALFGEAHAGGAAVAPARPDAAGARDEGDLARGAVPS